MVSLQKIEPSRFNEIYPLLQGFGSDLGEDTWRTLFEYQWERGSNYCGYGLFDDHTPVGFLGMIFSQRQIDQQTHDFCNLTSWIVRPDYRSHSLSMMMPIMRLKGHTITDLSASETVVTLSERLGFQRLDTTIRILLPCIGTGRNLDEEITFYSDDEITSSQLDASDKSVYDDHRPYANCRQLVLQTKQGYCHLLYTLNVDAKISYVHIQSISNVPLFKRYQAQIRSRIIRDAKLSLIILDSRLVTSVELPFSLEMPLSSPRLYRSQQLQATQIDNLYSEYILLGLTTDLGIRKRILDAFPMIKKVKRSITQRLSQPLPSNGV